MARRDARLERLAAVPLFRACNQKELARVGRAAEEITVAVGRDVVQEGETGHEFYVIMSGEAVVRRGGRNVAVLGPGDYFGELALLDRTYNKRDATVTATHELKLLSIGPREFAALIDGVPSMTHKIMAGMARRLHELDGKA